MFVLCKTIKQILCQFIRRNNLIQVSRDCFWMQAIIFILQNTLI